MKFIAMFAAAALALSPVLAVAQSTNDQPAAGTPTPGGVSQAGVLSVFSLATIPAGAVVVGSVVILSGVIVGVVAADDSTAATNTN